MYYHVQDGGMTLRSAQVDLTVTPYYHCMSRCVRRAYLCGKDRVSNQNFDHRRGWVQDRLRFLESLFAMDVCAYAVMSNHVHVVLRVDSDQAANWSDDEVSRRYTGVFPQTVEQLSMNLSPSQKKSLCATWRGRLCSLSWMMRALNEFIARKANKEEEVTGRFWEGRFKSQALVDEVGLLTCMAYVDLNPVRAGAAKSLAASNLTSIQERLHFAKERRRRHEKQSAPPHLAPFSDQANHSHLAMSFREYVKLLQWSGSVVKEGKHGHLEATTMTVLQARGISTEGWRHALTEKHAGQVSCLGSAANLERLAQERGQKWVHGLGLARRMQLESSANGTDSDQLR